MALRIVSWNVNSIRQRVEHLQRFTQEAKPDVLCLQETKVVDEDFPAEAMAAMGYKHQLIQGQKSYNGVAILSRKPFEKEEVKIWCGKDDKRHAAVTLKGGLEVHNFYVPSGGPKPDPEANEKFAHKLQFYDELAKWARALKRRKGAKVLAVGDMNVAPLEFDVWNHKKLLRSVGHTPGETEKVLAFHKAGGLTDIGRHFVPPDKPLYTWWGYRFPASFERNYGWRLDHALASADLMPSVKKMEVWKDTRTWEKPSDHVPIVVDVG